MIIETKDYGFKAYLILKYNALKIDNKRLKIDINKTEIELLKEYNNTEFPIYNEILKKIVKE